MRDDHASPADEYGSPLRAVLLSMSGPVVALLPVFLVGAMAVQIREELVFGAAGIGLATGAFRGAGALAAIPLGRRVDRWGPMTSLRRSATIAILAALWIAFAARDLPTLLVGMVLGGVATVIAQPAANTLIMRAVDVRRRATAFGIKQTSPPLSGMIAGFAVPVIALTLGWRVAFGLVAALGAMMLLALRDRDRSREPRPPQPVTQPLGRRRFLVIIMVTFALADVTNNTATVFYVESAVRAGTPPGLAGTIFAVASLGAILTRLASGVVADRMVTGHLRLCAGLLLLGAVGMALLSTGDPTLMGVGAVLAFCGTWGFNGVFWFSVVSAFPHAPGRVTGVLGPAGLMGSSLTPALFGGIADQVGFRPVWLIVCSSAVAAAIGMVIADRELRRSDA